MKRVFRVLYVFACVAVCAFASCPSYAGNDGVLVGNYGDWNVYTFLDGGKKVCFMSGQPRKQEGNYKKRGEAFFFVTHWFGEGNKNVVSVSNGYSFKEGAPATVSTGGREFSLFTRDEMAWTENQEEDDALVALLQKESSLVVMGTSSRGTKTTDTYSLKGSAAAWREMTKECTATAK
ncbi:MAG: invasion associated locus B family protein [Pseudomonadota bacterium]